MEKSNTIQMIIANKDGLDAFMQKHAQALGPLNSRGGEGKNDYITGNY